MRANPWLRQNAPAVLFCTGVFVALGAGLNWWCRPSVPTIAPEKVQSVEVRLFPTPAEEGDDPKSRQDELHFTTTDRAQIRVILDAFRGAERASDHKCGESGTILIRRRDGSVETVKILPGHNPTYYEYRYGTRINRVKRSPLLVALKAVGATRVKLEGP